MLRASDRRMPLWSYLYVFVLFALGTMELAGTTRNEEIALLGNGEADVTLKTLLVPDIMSLYGFIAAVFLQDGMLVSGVFFVILR